MPKKQSTKQRARVKNLPTAKKKLTSKEMKNVKGGRAGTIDNDETTHIKPRPDQVVSLGKLG